MRLKVQMIGLKKINAQFEKIQANVDKATLQALSEGALLVHSTAIKSIQSKEGTPRIVGGRKIIVSDPYNPPNTQTGRLIKSIRWVLNAANKLAQVGTDLKYGAYLEFGSKKINLLPRPWLRPAFLKHKKELGEIYVKLINAAIKKGAA